MDYYYQENSTDVDEHCTSDGSFVDNMRCRYREFVNYMRGMQYEDWAFNVFIVICIILGIVGFSYLVRRRKPVPTAFVAPPPPFR